MHDIILPRLGQTMERGRIAMWLRHPGDRVEVGDPLYEVESDKASVTVEAKRPGTIVELLVDAGEEVEVGTRLAVVADPGDGQPLADGGGATPALPSVAPTASRLGHAADASPSGHLPRMRETRPLNSTRAAMAAAVTRNWAVPQFVQMVTVDATSIAAARGRTPARSVTDLLVEGILAAVAEVPEANSRFERDSLIVFEDVNLGVAVATDGGLVVPVLHRVQESTPEERSAALADVLQRSREGRLAPADLEMGTITLSNLGMAGIEAGTPLLPEAQSVIVFAGAVRPAALVVDGAVLVRPALQLSIGFDHRALDGAQAARFTMALKRALEALR